MRAVVIAVKNGQAAVAGKGGTLTYIENRGYEIGQVLEISAEKTLPEGNHVLLTELPRGSVVRGVEAAVGRSDRRTAKILRFPGRNGARALHFGSSVAAALLVVLITGGLTANAAPISTVTLDVNPSVSYGLNVFDRVVSAEAHNEDGEELLKGLSGQVFGKRLPDAVEETLSALRDDEYITGEDTPTAATVASRVGDGARRRERLLAELKIGASDWNKEQKGVSVAFDAREVTQELSERARERGVTPGRILLEDMQKEQERQRAAEQPLPQEIQEPENRQETAPPEYGDPVSPGAEETESFRDDSNRAEPEDITTPEVQQEGGEGSPEQQDGAAAAPDHPDTGAMPPMPQNAGGEEAQIEGPAGAGGRENSETDQPEPGVPAQEYGNDHQMTPPDAPTGPPEPADDGRMMPEPGSSESGMPDPPPDPQMGSGGFSEPPGQTPPTPDPSGGPGSASFRADPR